MRKLTLALFALAGFLLISRGGARAQDEATRNSFLAQYTAISQLIQKGQAADAAKLVAPDFKHVSFLGKEGNAEQWASETKAVLTPFKAPSTTPSLSSLVIKGDEATAIFANLTTGDGTLANGRSGPLFFTITERSTWAKDGAAWKLKTVKHVMQDLRIDNGSGKKSLVPFKAPAADADAQQAIQQIYDLMSDVYGKSDWAALEKSIPDTFAIYDMTGAQINKKELIDRLKKGAKLLQNPVVFMNIQAMGRDGDSMKVVRFATVTGDVTLPDGKTGRLKYTNATRDTWVKGEKTWGSKKTEELHAEATLDGKPLPLAFISGN